MADVKIVKSIYTGADVTALGELASADNAKIPGTLEVTGGVVGLNSAASPVFTGATLSGLTDSRAVVTGTGGIMAASATTAAEIGFVSGLTSAVQTQLTTAQNLANAPKVNLLDNSGFGVWSNSGANQGIGSMPYDAGSVAPVVGEALTGGTSGAVGKVISFTLTGGAWGSSSAAGVISLGACAGRFNDNEAVTGSTAAALVVNTPAGAAGVDLVKGGEMEVVTDWINVGATPSVVGSGKYGNAMSIANDAADIGSVYQNIGVTAGKLYRFKGYVKKGTGAAVIYVGTGWGNAEYLCTEVLADADWTAYTKDFEATTSVVTISLYCWSTTAGQTALFDEISLYEITPGCTGNGYTGYSPDGMSQDNTGVASYRQHWDGGTITKAGSFYSLKYVPSGANHYIGWIMSSGINPKAVLFRGRTITFGAWVKTSTASHARLWIYADGSNFGSYHTGGGSWEWLELSYTVGSPTDLGVNIWSTAAPNVDGSTVVYVSQPMLVFGSSIGSGNYSPKPSETVLCETAIGFTALDNVVSQSDVVDAVLNVEANTAGNVPKGAKALLVSAATNDSGSAGTDCSMSLGMSATNYSLILSPAGLANGAKARQAGLVTLDANGDFHYVIDASGSATFDITKFKIVGVQLR